MVSHDRAFLENTVTQVIAFEGNGVLDEFGGGYDDWVRYHAQKLEDAKNATPLTAASNKASQPVLANKVTAKKLSFNEQKELETLPDLIATLEAEQAEIVATLADGEIYRTKPEQAKALQSRLAEVETKTEQALQRWEALEARG